MISSAHFLESTLTGTEGTIGSSGLRNINIVADYDYESIRNLTSSLGITEFWKERLESEDECYFYMTATFKN